MKFTCKIRPRITGGSEMVVETTMSDGIIKSIAFPIRELEKTRIKDIIAKHFNIEKELIEIL